MIRLVAAVAGPLDAEAALAGGADALVLLASDQLARTRDAIGERAPLALAGEGADIRIADWPGEAQGSGRRIARLVLGEAPPACDVPKRIADAGFEGVAFIGEHTGGVLRHLGTGALERLADACRDARLLFGFAGALEAPDVPRLAVLKPDFLVFRRSLGGGERDGTLRPDAVRALRQHLHREAGGTADPAGSGETDRVFVRDMTVAMEIGAYGSEHGRRQSVRFSIEGAVLRPERRPAAMADIYSYDIMMDAVRALVARGHTDLVETLAEDLAAVLLRDPRLLAVTVRVEKLELGPAAVGIEIRRSR